MDAVTSQTPVRFGKNPFPQSDAQPNAPPKRGGKKESSHDNVRTRVFSLVTYANDEQIMYTLSIHHEQIRYSTFIMHDKCLNDDGTPKGIHYHVVIETYNAYRVGSVRKWFSICKNDDGDTVNTLGQPVIDRKECISYLTHEHHKEKHQYSREDIVNYSEALLIAHEKPRNDDDKALLILDDMISGVPEYILCRRYGREYIINAHRYRDMVFNIIDDHSLPQLSEDLKKQLYRKYYYGGR